MSSILAPLLFFSIFLFSFTETPLWEKMERLKWKNRVIVMYSPEGRSGSFQKQKQILAEQKKGIEERDLVLIECVGKTISSEDKNYIARHFDHDLTKFGVWLIGKDGGTKLSESQPVTTQKFFSLIDAMPMRQSEMKRNGER